MMNNDKHPMTTYWEEARKKGFWRYLLRSGLAVGIAVGVAMWLLELWDRPVAELLTLPALLRHFLLPAVLLMFAYGISTWFMYEWMLKRSQNPEADS